MDSYKNRAEIRNSQTSSPTQRSTRTRTSPPAFATRFVSTGVRRSMDGDGASRGQPMLEKRPGHRERHFTAGEVVRDVIMGVSDGLTVPFALAAGLSGASAPSSLVLTAGLAEVAAGAISMGLGRYLAAQSEADHYRREMKREQEEIITVPDTEAAEIGEIMSQYGLEPHEYGPVIDGLRRNPQAWLEFMMRFELGLEKPDPKRALQSACTIALSYVIGGLVPLLPYMFISTAQNAMLISVGVTLVALLFFGYIKGRFTGNRPFISAVQTAIIGALASAAAYGMAKAVQAR